MRLACASVFVLSGTAFVARYVHCMGVAIFVMLAAFLSLALLSNPVLTLGFSVLGLTLIGRDLLIELGGLNLVQKSRLLAWLVIVGIGLGLSINLRPEYRL